MKILLIISTVVFLASCSTTPGDAANRSGHFEQSAELYESGAKLGDALAAQKLANLYNVRPGLPEDHQKAVMWYEKAIDLGDIPSNWYLGVIYRDGSNNVAQDLQKAEEYFTTGSNSAHHYSMYDLAKMHADRQVASPSDTKGQFWLETVTIFASDYCSKSNEGCQWILQDPYKLRERFQVRLNSKEIENAKKSANNWVKNYVKNS